MTLREAISFTGQMIAATLKLKSEEIIDSDESE
jgi:hypothetical protein